MYRGRKRSWVKHLDFTVIDIVCLELALILAYAVRFDGGLVFTDKYFDAVVWLIILFDIVITFFTEPYNGILRRNKYGEFRACLLHVIYNFGAIVVYLYARQVSFFFSRQTLFMFAAFAFVLIYLCRIFRKRWIRRKKLADVDKNAMYVIAETSTVDACVMNVAHNRYMDFKVRGVIIVDEDLTGQEIQGIPVVASANTCVEFLRTNVVDEVFIDGNTRASSEALADELVEIGLTVHVSLVSSRLLTINRQLETYGDYVVLTSSMHIASNGRLFWKRLMDIVGSLVGLLFAGIAFVIFAPIIKIQSPGPVFYKSTRIGRGGRRFDFYKFRTMVVDADQQKKDLMDENVMDGNMFKMEDDPRIIPIGHFMRKHSIDELPQFYNVLKGDMSLVGTRPPTEEEFEAYQARHKARLGIKPGLSGIWQVSGRNDITNFEDIVKMDTEYIANWSPVLDLWIIFKTIGVVFTGRGSK